MKIHKLYFKYPVDIYPVSFVIVFFIIQIIACIYLTHTYAIVFAVCSLYFLSIPAAFNHHHQHHRTFHQAWLNRILEMILGLQTGITPFMWMLHHNIGHHQYYLNQMKDTSPWKKKDSTERSKLEYGIFNMFFGFRQLSRMGRKFPKLRKHYKISRLTYYGCVLSLYYLLGINYLIILLIPSLIVAYCTIQTTWYHHSGLNSLDHFNASRNNISKYFNFRTCNLGYHTAHHLKPGLHWSLLPKFHDQIKHKIPSHLIRKNIWHA